MNEMDANSQKTPLAQALHRLSAAKAEDALAQLGKGLPCTIVSVENGQGIVEVNFEVNSGLFTLPKVTVPIGYPEYIRYPIKKDDKGWVVSASVRLGGLTGLGGGTPYIFDRPGNLAALVFLFLGNTEWSMVNIDPGALNLYSSQQDVVLQISTTGAQLVGDNANLFVSGTLGSGNGATGTFTTPTGQTVTVQDGIITSIY